MSSEHGSAWADIEKAVMRIFRLNISDIASSARLAGAADCSPIYTTNS
jgi:hypothetical protein